MVDGRDQTAEPDGLLSEDGYLASGDVRIHYVARGSGPLFVLIHGTPGFWYDWRHQLPALARHFRVVAIDQRGFNLSDRPEGVPSYAREQLVGDVEAVLRHFGESRAILVGHDSGGWIEWSYAMCHPQRTSRFVILNLPHPGCLERELAASPRQYEASA